MSGRVVQFVVRFGYRFSSDFAGRHGTQKSPQTVQVQGLFGLYRMPWVDQVAERVGFEPTYRDKPVTRFRVERVTAASLPLRPAKTNS